jgi:hypothetical protein
MSRMGSIDLWKPRCAGIPMHCIVINGEPRETKASWLVFAPHGFPLFQAIYSQQFLHVCTSDSSKVSMRGSNIREICVFREAKSVSNKYFPNDHKSVRWSLSGHLLLGALKSLLSNLNSLPAIASLHSLRRGGRVWGFGSPACPVKFLPRWMWNLFNRGPLWREYFTGVRDKYRPWAMSKGRQSQGWWLSLVWTFVQRIQKSPKPGWIGNDYLNEEQGGQWQEECDRVHQEYSQWKEYTVCHAHHFSPNKFR